MDEGRGGVRICMRRRRQVRKRSWWFEGGLTGHDGVEGLKRGGGGVATWRLDHIKHQTLPFVYSNQHDPRRARLQSMRPNKALA